MEFHPDPTEVERMNHSDLDTMRAGLRAPPAWADIVPDDIADAMAAPAVPAASVATRPLAVDDDAPLVSLLGDMGADTGRGSSDSGSSDSTTSSQSESTGSSESSSSDSST